MIKSPSQLSQNSCLHPHMVGVVSLSIRLPCVCPLLHSKSPLLQLGGGFGLSDLSFPPGFKQTDLLLHIRCKWTDLFKTRSSGLTCPQPHTCSRQIDPYCHRSLRQICLGLVLSFKQTGLVAKLNFKQIYLFEIINFKWIYLSIHLNFILTYLSNFINSTLTSLVLSKCITKTALFPLCPFALSGQ